MNQNPERSKWLAGETDRQLAKNAPIDVGQTAKQVPNPPPGGGGGGLLKWVSNRGGQNSQSALAHCSECSARSRSEKGKEESRSQPEALANNWTINNSRSLPAFSLVT
jgi:hypothetical protein